jgi:hypothetical protein
MARKSNVNPDHYKTAGRDPQGQAVLQEVERQKLKEGQSRLLRATAGSVPAPRRTRASATPAAPKPKAEKEKARNQSSCEGS